MHDAATGFITSQDIRKYLTKRPVIKALIHAPDSFVHIFLRCGNPPEVIT